MDIDTLPPAELAKIKAVFQERVKESFVNVTSDLHVEGSHSDKTVNRECAVAIGGLLVLVGLTYLVEQSCFPRFAERFMPLWLIALLVVSYAALIPGISSMLFFTRMTLTDPRIPHNRLEIIFSTDSMQPYITETMSSLVFFLFDGGNYPAGILVGFYGFGVPALKLILLVAAAFLRHQPARHCKLVNVIQFISKFDSPKLVCYVLIMLIISGQGRPGPPSEGQVDATFHLDLGYMYYFVFCMFSLLGALMLPCEQPKQEQVSPLLVRRYGLSQRDIFVFNACLSLIFFTFFYFTMFVPLISAKLDWATASNLQLLDPLYPLEQLEKMDWPTQDISLSSSISQLLTLVGNNGDVNAFLGWLILAVFVVFFTVADMLVLLFASFLVWRNLQQPNDAQLSRAVFLMKVAHWLKYLSMLDVAAFGVAITSVAVKVTFGSIGIHLMARSGIVFLVIAEVLHYVVYYQTASTVEFFARAKEDN